MKELQNTIEKAWENRELLKEPKTQDAIREVIQLIDDGKLRCAEPVKGEWQINEWVK
ncbi:MAG: 2,3,4,5-tetrahydropyridine-2,6-dicarboxylate N-succinyltransferase, partial [Eudoraea sp.]|nr:2,3,4,5-tetrahydropyridine-2,6-dicarboxylate N-succinyltransferase [Eudoraea sp.]